MHTKVNTIARFAIAIHFLFQGLLMAASYDHQGQWLVDDGIPGISILPILLMAIKLEGGLFLLLGYKVRYAAGFLIGIALLSPMLFQTGLAAILKNAAIAAGLLLLISNGTGETLWEYIKVDIRDLPDYKTRL